jgi:hypothetical protein
MEEQCDTASHDISMARRQHVTTAFYLYFREIAESTACRHWPFVVANAPLAAPLGVGSRAAIPDGGDRSWPNRGLNTAPTP